MNKSNKGFTLVELLVVIGILGILMGALFPAISSAMLSANASSMSMRGRKLFEGITQCNIEREGKGLPSMWPVSADQQSDDGEDIAGMPFSDATTYFKEVFDIDNYGTAEWDPYVRSCDISVLSGSGVPSMSGSDLQQQNVAWIVCKGVTSEMEDIIPVLVSRNLSTDQFAKQSTTETSSKTTQLPTDTQFPLPFGNKASVIIHKGGAASVFKGRYQSLSDIYDRQTVTFTEGSKGIDYISPSAN